MQVNPGSKRNWDLIFNLKTILQTCNAGDRETFFKVLLVHPLFSERERERGRRGGLLVKRFIPLFLVVLLPRSYLSFYILMDSTNEDASLPFRLFAINQCLSSR